MFPFVYAPTYEYPLSGNVTQGISPTFAGEIAGLPEVEYEVITSVASYGTQLGKLSDAVLALAEHIGLDNTEIATLRQISDDVQDAKKRARDAVQARADALAERADRLAKL